MPASNIGELPRTLAGNLRRLRAAKGWTQEQAAEEAGINWRHWQKLEAGEVNVTLNTLGKICDGMGVEIRDLFSSSVRRCAARRFFWFLPPNTLLRMTPHPALVVMRTRP